MTLLIRPSILFLLLFFNTIAVADNYFTIQSTTSTRDSGFFEHIIPVFEEKHNMRVRVIAVGTGQALKNIKNCDGDVAITHAREQELLLLKENIISERHEFMYNDFIFVGPQNDPASIAKSSDPVEALTKIFSSQAVFISRGDNSGTHTSELSLWERTGLNPKNHRQSWYLEVGQGMGASLNIAIGRNGYIYTDRATWLNFKNKANHRELYSGHTLLYNQYSLLVANPTLCSNFNQSNASLFKEWLLSNETLSLINDLRINGKQLYFTNN